MGIPEINIRPAKRPDALNLAQLIDIAGEGIPCYLWQQSCKKGQWLLENDGIQAQCLHQFCCGQYIGRKEA